MGYQHSRDKVKDSIIFNLTKDVKLSYGQLIDRIRCHRQTLTDALSELVGDDFIRKERRGIYSLNTSKELDKRYSLLKADYSKLNKQIKKHLNGQRYQYWAYLHVMHILSIISYHAWVGIHLRVLKGYKPADLFKHNELNQKWLELLDATFIQLHEKDPEYTHKLNDFVPHKLTESFKKSTSFN